MTVRTSSGFSTYHINELDSAWANSHYDKIHTQLKQRQMDAFEGVVALAAGLVGRDSLAKATPFLQEYRKVVVPISCALAVYGAALCLWGWRIYRFWAVLSGTVFGALMGGMLGVSIGYATGDLFPAGVSGAARVVLAALLGLAFGVTLGRWGGQFAMRNARIRSMGKGGGLPGLVFGLSRMAFFDSGIIWGQALFGALLMLLGLYCASVPVLNIEPDDLQVTLCLATIIGLSLAVCGAVRQVRVMRTNPPEGYGDHY